MGSCMGFGSLGKVQDDKSPDMTGRFTTVPAYFGIARQRD